MEDTQSVWLALSLSWTNISVNNMLVIHATVSEILSLKMDGTSSEWEGEASRTNVTQLCVRALFHPTAALFQPSCGKRKLWEPWDTGEVETWAPFTYE